MKFILPNADKIAAAINLAATKDSHSIAHEFRKQHTIEPNLNWDFLEQVFNIHFQPRNSAEPFVPMIVMDGRRSMVPTDLSNEQLDALKETLDTSFSASYRARIGDILWLCRNDFQAAQIAVDAYIESGILVEDLDMWVPSMDCYERAVRLARSLGKNNDSFTKATEHLIQRIRHHDGNDPSWFTHHGSSILLEFRQGAPLEFAEILGKIAYSASVAKDFRRAQEHHGLEAKFFKRAGDHDNANRALKARAEQIVAEAEEREAQDLFMAAHHFWNLAIQAYRSVPDSRERILELHRRMNQAGERMLGEFKPIGTKIDISPLVEQATNVVKETTLTEAICTLAGVVCQPISPTNLRKEVETTLRETPLQALMPASILDAGGRIVDIRPSAMTDDPTQREKAIQGFMTERADLNRGISVAGYIVPAMRQILSENFVEEDAIRELLANSFFIPKDRVPIFARGIRMGFEWDFSTALHLLIPQTENSLRHILAQNKIITTSLDAVGIEEAWPLGKILSEPRTKEALGEEHCFELRTLLLGQPGANIRNLLAHGLLGDDKLQGHVAIYLWWLILRLAVLASPIGRSFLKDRPSTTR